MLPFFRTPNHSSSPPAAYPKVNIKMYRLHCNITEYIQPTKTNCFQLTSGRSGVYTFGNERELNEGGRDFYQQYCEYSTEGTAWTVIQKRDNFEAQEDFNQTWNDYKFGFGNLSKDFWFGNDFIHK